MPTEKFKAPINVPITHLQLRFSPRFFLKVEKIFKGSLDSIPSPSPSVKIQVMGLSCKGKILLGVVNKLMKENKKFVDITQLYFGLLPKVNLPANFH